MKLSAWRIVQSRHASTAFDGEGARCYGGRWNNPGTAIVYTSESLALAQLELLVHLPSPDVLRAYVSIHIEFDARLIEDLDVHRWPKDWMIWPAPKSTRTLGDEWVRRGAAALLRVPSVVVPTESNFLVNPGHKDFGKIRIGAVQPLTLDPRLRKHR